MPHDCNAFAYIVGAVALYDETFLLAAVRNLFDNFESLVCSFAVVVVEFCLNIGEAVDAGDDLSSVFSETVQDDAELVRAYFVGIGSDLDCALCSSERFVACEEAEALAVFRKKTCAEIAVSETDFAVISNRTRKTECLESFADSCRSVRTGDSAGFLAFLYSDCRTEHVCPFSIFKADLLCLLADIIRIKTA